MTAAATPATCAPDPSTTTAPRVSRGIGLLIGLAVSVTLWVGVIALVRSSFGV